MLEAAQREAGAVVAAVRAPALAAEKERSHLKEASTHLDVNGQSTGSVMAPHQNTAAAACAVLRRACNEHNTKLHVIAEKVTTGEIGADRWPLPTAAARRLPARRSRSTKPVGEVMAGTGPLHSTWSDCRRRAPTTPGLRCATAQPRRWAAWCT